MSGLARCARRAALVIAAASSLAACASVQPKLEGAYAPQKIGKPYQVGGIWYVPRAQPNYDEVGTASWYGDAFHLKATANGEVFDMNAVTAAHTTLPLPCIVEVTNLENGRRLKVRVNDRGPFVGDRIIDLSREAARELGFERQGITRVRVRYVGPAPMRPAKAGVRVAKASPPPKLPEPPAQLASAAPAAVNTSATPPGASASLTWRPVSPASLGEPQQAPTPATATAESGFRIQAGAFSVEANARRAAAQLARLAEPRIDPVERDGTVLYRVTLAAPADELQAYGLREQVAQQGFADARVVRAF